MNADEGSRPAGGACSPRRWGASTIALHWLSAVLVLILLGLGWFMVHGDLEAPTKFDLYQLHKSLGFLSLALLLLRLGARLPAVAARAANDARLGEAPRGSDSRRLLRAAAYRGPVGLAAGFQRDNRDPVAVLRPIRHSEFWSAPTRRCRLIWLFALHRLAPHHRAVDPACRRRL